MFTSQDEWAPFLGGVVIWWQREMGIGSCCCHRVMMTAVQEVERDSFTLPSVSCHSTVGDAAAGVTSELDDGRANSVSSSPPPLLLFSSDDP